MPDDADLHLLIESDALSVRAALQTLFHTRALDRLTPSDRASAELVLAEVLNNIVEHGQPVRQATIELCIRVTPDGLDCTVVDSGRRMPGNGPPRGDLPGLSGSAADLPEGGFGWHLIRLLATDLAYRRTDQRNELSFRLTARQSA